MHNDELFSLLKRANARLDELERDLAQRNEQVKGLSSRLCTAEKQADSLKESLLVHQSLLCRLTDPKASTSNDETYSRLERIEAREAITAARLTELEQRKFAAAGDFITNPIVEPRHVILYGNPVDGFNVVGPFSCRQDAVNYGETEPASPDSSSWWIAKLEEPALTDRED